MNLRPYLYLRFVALARSSMFFFFFFVLRILSIFNTHTQKKRGECLKGTDSGRYAKRPKM